MRQAIREHRLSLDRAGNQVGDKTIPEDPRKAARIAARKAAIDEAEAKKTNKEHHQAASMFPRLSDLDLESLAQDIKANGLQNPIVLFEDKILDGRNRARACEIAGVEPQFIAWEPNGRSPILWVLSQNLRRRQLTPSQRAFVALFATPLLDEESKQRQSVSPGGKGDRLLNA